MRLAFVLLSLVASVAQAEAPLIAVRPFIDGRTKVDASVHRQLEKVVIEESSAILKGSAYRLISGPCDEVCRKQFVKGLGLNVLGTVSRAGSDYVAFVRVMDPEAEVPYAAVQLRSATPEGLGEEFRKKAKVLWQRAVSLDSDKAAAIAAAEATLAAWVKGCNEGDLAACNSAGYAYLYGEGAPQDDAKGAAFYEKTCGARNAEGCAFFGWVLEKGLGGHDQNETKAAATYEKGCQDGKGNSFACTLLGVLHTEGRGVKKNLAKAAQLYRSGCDLGDGEGCLRLGWAYQQGTGVTQSTTLAQELFEKGCHLDNDEACTELDD